MIPRAFRHYVESMRNFNLPRNDLDALQTKRLRRTLRVAYDHVPYNHDLLRGMGKTPADIRGKADLGAFPMLKKETLIERRSELISTAANATFGRLGSGTSGKVVSMAFDAFFRDITIALQARQLTLFGIRTW